MITIKHASITVVTRAIRKNPTRTFSKYLDKDISSKATRQKFLDFFVKENNHNFVRSSPVVPYCDPTVAFVNAGMNQFKGVLLGNQTAEHSRVANSQKCVRVGGKHNDLNVVGVDGYHHTFFEMLGNWSFGDYFKNEACEMAWKLLTQCYKIDKKILYVTYFGGDKELGLEPDLECKDIWRRLGITNNRIIPFGIKDNFWEMGSTGPCGPCTEIHVDRMGPINRAKFINMGLPDLTELWNIVFIQYNRTPDGKIQPLPQKHIDTGMGLERLTALLQNKLSNYDTDVFSGIFSAIEKSCKKVPNYGGQYGESDWNSLDAGYRILADHSRMITVCLADGMIPEQNQKLRRIIRKVFSVSECSFKKESGLLKELSNYVVENLGPAYPEMEKNIKQIHQIIDYEEDVYKSIRKNATQEWNKLIENEPILSTLDIVEMPGVVAAYKDIKRLNGTAISSSLGFKLYDSFGLDEDAITKLSTALNLKFDIEGFRNELDKAKVRSRQKIMAANKKIEEELARSRVKTTNDTYKYDYRKKSDAYIFEDLEVGILKIIFNNAIVADVGKNMECSLILNKTNFYSEAGGQIGDRGTIKFSDGIFEIIDTQNLNGYVIHKGIYKSDNKSTRLHTSMQGVLKLDQDFRLKNMRNHTATHLLNATLKCIKGATCQKSSKVTDNYLNLDVGVFCEKLTIDDLEKLELEINNVIKNAVDVKVKNIDSLSLLSMDNVTLVPGEIYPESNIRLVEISVDNFSSREACCGTHILNTKDIEDFCIIKHKSLGRSTTSLCAVTGPRAKQARKNGQEMFDQIESLETSLNDNMDKPQVLALAVTSLKQQLSYDVNDSTILPIVVKQQCSKKLNSISKRIKDTAKDSIKEFIEIEMRHILETNKDKTKTQRPYVVHYLQCSTMLDTIPLQRATKICQNVPVLVISYSDNMVKARCCVPENLRNEKFNAEKWLNATVASVFKSPCAPSTKEQDAGLVCNMKSRKVNIKDWDMLLGESIKSAKEYIETNL